MILKPSKKACLTLMSLILVSGCASKTGLRDKDLQIEKSLLKTKQSQVSTSVEKQAPDSDNRDFKVEQVDDWGGITRLQEDAKTAPRLEGEAITFSADEMPVKEFTNKVFQELLGINYVMSPQLSASNDTITLNLSSAIERQEFYRVAMKALEESGVTSYRKDEILYLSKSSGATQKNSIAVGIGNKEQDVPDVAGPITHIVPYVYSSSRNVSSILSKLSTAKVTINSLQKLIILEGERAELTRAIKIINMLDVPRAFGREIRLFEFAHISPLEGIEQIEKLLQEDGLQVSKEGDVSFVPLPRINSFVAYAANQETIARVGFWARKIDVPLAGDERQYFIYKPKYAKADDMRESLTVLLQGRSQAGGNSDSAGKAAMGGQNSNVKFSLDKQQNALIFYTDKDEYRLIESLLKKMDVLPGQVILDVTILEITLTDEMSSGIKWLYNKAGASGNDALTLDSATGALFGQVISGDWKAEFNWNDAIGDARVLSRPYFIVRDGESATLSSGDQIPIITQTVENIGNNNSVSNSIQYRSTGVNVSITPIINSQGVVTLSVSMSVSDGKPNKLGVSSPTITNRSITTEVLSGDGQTVALGGLIQEKKSDFTQGVPGLSELPVLGNLFKAKEDTMQRTELMMLITTKVVKSESEVDEFGEAISELYSAPIIIK
ncbi:secretin N-terminal domain-containing protein [Pseudoalteromonas sp. T1lg23B]|uniref:secretin N-terminal domain-containing protein n=1 Tax=Pseudoalteromonas sp. T1lg23B TaxID=2077097 RepID=UPI001319DFDF|nr:secretin N-terminal domain-containing protein [Pseudoalteromonas sp. T1lg23B]